MRLVLSVAALFLLCGCPTPPVIPPSAIPLAITSPLVLPSAHVGTFYSFQFTATGGVIPYTWSPVTMPAWGTLTPGGLFAGDPPTVGSEDLTLTVKDSGGSSASIHVVVSSDSGVLIAASRPAADRNLAGGDYGRQPAFGDLDVDGQCVVWSRGVRSFSGYGCGAGGSESAHLMQRVPMH